MELEDMQIKKITIKNFRLLKSVVVDLEKDLSLIIGKNNCGKTSLLFILDKFIGGGLVNTFNFDDFNIDLKNDLKSFIENDEWTYEKFPFIGISLKLFIEYDEKDNLSSIGNKVIMDLDPENKFVVLAFEYFITELEFKKLKSDFKDFCEKRVANKKNKKDVFYFLKERHAQYFKISRKSVRYDIEKGKEDETIFTDLIKEKIPLDGIINFKYISAKRSVSNKDSEKSLSSQSSRIYKKLEAKNRNSEAIEKFKDALSDTDEDLNKIYDDIFKDVINDVSHFGGIKENESIIKVVSSLQHRELLEENTTVMYGLGAQDHLLPEGYNGLGYMNLISMIFEIKLLIHEFQKEKDEKPSDINLLLIEEPEAHTHPQMQRIFIKNIKSLLGRGVVREDGENRSLQAIITTHSSHIVSESDFEDIKYFKREGLGIVSKNLKDLKTEYGENSEYYKFLRQYLTIHRSELFFADKAIFVEGDTERILLPSMMRKIDQEDMLNEAQQGVDAKVPLLSQHISLIEVGAYSQIFEKFIDFVGIKSLIITDIDSIQSVPKVDDQGNVEKNSDGSDKMKDQACRVDQGTKTSNGSLKYFYGKEKSLAELIGTPLESRILKKDKVWKQAADGHLLCVYQMNEEDSVGNKYHARSFEDAFLHINRKFIRAHTFDERQEFIGNIKFPSLTQKKMKEFAASEIDSFEMACEGIDSKPSFAIEVLLNSKNSQIQFKVDDEDVTMISEFSNWNIPAYIKEGLRWLKAD